MDESHPGKLFATEVFTTTRANLPKFSRNGTDSNGNSRWPWRKKSSNGLEENHTDENDTAK
jgi:hypothetical protein